MASNPQDSFVKTEFQPGTFWDRRHNVIKKNSLPRQLEMLRTTGRYDAFDLKWHKTYDDPPNIWPVPNHLFWDSDVAKWIEGVAYLAHANDQDAAATDDLAIEVGELIKKIQKAQQPDGYLNIHFTVVAPEKRFSNLRDLHELYNAGHLIEAGLAHSKRFNSQDLFDPIQRYARYLVDKFGTNANQIRGYPGHPEIELALVRLYRATQDESFLKLARYFVEERGNPTGVDGQHYYDVEAKARGEDEHTQPRYYPAPRSYWYQQAHKPLLEQETIEGHAVRAMYLLTAVADIATLDQAFAKRYIQSLQRLWRNMVHQRMYLTGGIGAMEKWEGFGIDYFLPQSSEEGGCYSETCAALGIMMFAERMLQLELKSEYADVLERCLYNSVLTGMSTDGKAFTYVNQLASSQGHASERHEWFDCACCPPNIARVLGHIGGYFWTAETVDSQAVSVNVHLYGSATIKHKIEGADHVVTLAQSSKWPWEGKVDFALSSPSRVSVTVRLRIPGWAEGFQITPPPPSSHLRDGYVELPSAYLQSHSEFSLSIPFTPRLLYPHPFTNQPIAALARGPIVYCVEDFDHQWVDDHFKSVVIDPRTILDDLIETEKSDLPQGETYVGITAPKSARFLHIEFNRSSTSSEPNSRNDSVNGVEINGNSHTNTNSSSTTTTNATTGSADDKTASNMSVGGGPEFFTQSQSAASKSVCMLSSKEPEDLHFVPYYARANRGGKGMMRVGLRVLPSPSVSGRT